MRQTIEQRVARGIELLNDKGPKGWRRKVRVTKLDMSNPYTCVLGQVYDGVGWRSGYEAAGDIHLRGVLRGGERAATYGFHVYNDESDSFEALTAEWRRQLKAVPR